MTTHLGLPPLTANNALPVEGVSNGSPMTVGGIAALAYSETVRPADSNAYGANDVVCNSTSVPAVGSLAIGRIAGGSGYIVGTQLETNQSTCVARFRVHFFHTAPTAINDNAPYTMLYANVLKRIGSIDLVAMNTEGAGSDAAKSFNGTDRLLFALAAADANVYYIIETLDVFTPASGQKFTLRLSVDRN